MSRIDDLVAEARRAEEGLIDAEHRVDVARADYHRAIRRVHLAGASLREIATALHLSHQRVHQIIEATGGSRRWRRGRDRSPVGHRSDIAPCSFCSFCGQSRGKVNTLIAGPDVYICDRCVEVAEAVAAGRGPLAGPSAPIHALNDDPALRCSFCAKSGERVPAMASSAEHRICRECLHFCQEILTEHLA